MHILIAGTGSIGRRHIANIQQLVPNCTFTLIRSQASQDSYSFSLGALVVPSFKEALRHQIDLFIIATPSALHLEYILNGVKYGIPMYIEKPVVTSNYDIQLIREAVLKSSYSAPTQVGCNLRFLPSLIKMSHILIAGEIGTVAHASFQAGQWLPDWRPSQDHTLSYSATPQMGGGVLFDLVHEIDSARWLLGDLSPLCCFTQSIDSLRIDTESVALSILRNSGNTLVSISLDYVARSPLRRYQFVGDQGTLIWDLFEKKLILYHENGEHILASGNLDFDINGTYKTAIMQLIACINSEGDVSQPLEEGLKTADLAIQLKNFNE